MELTKKQLAKYIDHTNLRPQATSDDISLLVMEAKKAGFYSVCVNPCHVQYAKKLLRDSDVLVSCVVGFPLGATFIETKVLEAKKAVERGADELDMVINLGALKEGKYSFVVREIKEVVRVARGIENVKVIIELPLLTRQEAELACKAVLEGGASFVKTSTGFNVRPVIKEDVLLLKEISGGSLKIKAAGGIRTYEQALELIKAGAHRLGTSSGYRIWSEAPDRPR